MHKKFEKLFHQYKLDVFKVEHHQKDVEEIANECLHICEDMLSQKYSYHFHKLPDADRAEIINMINNYTREAILPPIVNGLVERQVILERRCAALENLLHDMLEVLSSEPVQAN